MDGLDPLGRFVRAVGWTSIGLAASATAAPRRVAAAGGVLGADSAAVPVLVRLVAARQAAIGVAVLSRRPTEVRRNADLFLPLTALDAGAVLQGVRSGALDRRAGAMSVAVLAVNAAVGLGARR